MRKMANGIITQVKAVVVYHGKRDIRSLQSAIADAVSKVPGISYVELEAKKMTLKQARKAQLATN